MEKLEIKDGDIELYGKNADKFGEWILNHHSGEEFYMVAVSPTESSAIVLMFVFTEIFGENRLLWMDPIHDRIEYESATNADGLGLWDKINSIICDRYGADYDILLP